MNLTPPTVEDGIVAIVSWDIDVAVASAVARTTSPHVATADLESSLDQLRDRLHLLVERRPDLARQLADHYGTTPDPVRLDAATTRDAHARLHQLMGLHPRPPAPPASGWHERSTSAERATPTPTWHDDPGPPAR